MYQLNITNIIILIIPYDYIGAYTNTLQDHYVLILSNDKSGGYYVDLATNHYKLGSNTYALDIFNNWQGICIEPNPIHHIQILSHRRCELFVNPVSSKPGEEVLFRFENPGDAGLGGLGILSLIDIINKNYIFNVIIGGIVGEQFDNKGSNAGDVHLITTTLTSILDQANAPRKIDYLSLDVEGAEFYVLKDFNYTKYTFSILTIERPNEDSHYVLIKNGYKFITLLSDYGECLYLHNTTNNFEYWVNKYHHIGVTPHWHNKKKEYLLLSQIF